MTLEQFRASMRVMTQADADAQVWESISETTASPDSVILVYEGLCWMERRADGVCHLVLERDEHVGAQADLEIKLYDWWKD